MIKTIKQKEASKKNVHVGSRVFWLYNPNLHGYISRMNEKTFKVCWEKVGVFEYPIESLEAIGVF